MDPGRTLQRHLKKRRPQRRTMHKWRLKPLLVSLVAIVGIFGLMVVIPSMALKIAGLDRPAIPLVGKGLQIYDRYDRKICTIYGERDQQLVKLKDISPHVVKAFLAAEDHDYYYHGGINVLAILRAVLVDITAGQPLQGGSTISQQLIKNLYFEGKKRTVSDKITEAFMAMDIEKRYSKEQILEAYLNYVYFGRGVYGVQRASETYFGKHPSKLNLAESAFLAGLVTAPSELSQVSNRKRAITRQHLTLNSMEELKFATPDEVKAAKAHKLVFRTYTNPAERYPHYTAEVMQFCKQHISENDLYQKGFRVYTNMDAAAQELAERMLANGIRTAPKGINEGALVSVSVEDGGIIALVGGAGPRSEWNRALSPHTAGSAFKPFVYLAALSKGVLSPDAMLDDEPLEITQVGSPAYKPKNYDGGYLGPITIRKAIALSRNTCAVRVAQAVGPGEVVKTARLAGINSRLDENLSLALGSSAVTPLEMANAYATLARGGEYVEPQLVRMITDEEGNTIKQFEQKRQPAFDKEPVAQLVDALQDVVEKGTGTRARLFDRPVAGKTGTSDEGKDIWFVGFTPDMVTAVWGGNDHNKPVQARVTGGTVMAKIWHNYMSSYYRQHDIPPGSFPQPEHPLMEEPEPIHIWPTPSQVFQFFGGWWRMPEPPPVRNYHWAPPRDYNDGYGYQQMKREIKEFIGDNDDDHQRREEKKKDKKKKKGLMRKMKDLLDF